MKIFKNLRVYLLLGLFAMLSLFVFSNIISIPAVKISKEGEYYNFKFNTMLYNQTDVPIKISIVASPNAAYGNGTIGSQNNVYIDCESKEIKVDPFATERCMIVFHADNKQHCAVDWGTSNVEHAVTITDSAKICINGQEVVKTSPYIINVLRTGKDFEQAILTVQQDYQAYYKDSNTNKVYRLQMFVSGDTLSIFVTRVTGDAPINSR